MIENITANFWKKWTLRELIQVLKSTQFTSGGGNTEIKVYVIQIPTVKLLCKISENTPFKFLNTFPEDAHVNIFTTIYNISNFIY